MQPFYQTYSSEEEIERLKQEVKSKFNISDEQAEIQVRDAIKGTTYRNDVYQVLVRDADVHLDFPPMLWLSIKRIDREPIHDWRDLQKIKNMLVGDENEGVEIYPAESRLVDAANQYHIFVLKDNTIKFPFGFHDGRRVDDENTIGRAKQRKF